MDEGTVAAIIASTIRPSGEFPPGAPLINENWVFRSESLRALLLIASQSNCTPLLCPLSTKHTVALLESDTGYSIHITRSFSCMHFWRQHRADRFLKKKKKNYLISTAHGDVSSVVVFSHCDPFSLFKPFFLSPGSRLLHTKPAAFSAFLFSCFPHPQHLPHLPDSCTHARWGLWLPSVPAREGPCLTQSCRAMWSPCSSSARAGPGCMRSRNTHPGKDFFQ